MKRGRGRGRRHSLELEFSRLTTRIQHVAVPSVPVLEAARRWLSPQSGVMAFAWLGVQGVLSGSPPEPSTESPAPDAPSIDATPTPLERLSSFVGGGDVSTLLTRFFQFGALGSFLQLLGISETFRWLFNSLYEYVIGRFILTVHFDGDELPYL